MNDQYEGQGGSYLIDESGARVLIERTGHVAEVKPEPPTLTEIIPQDEPANAGLFSPVAPADHSTETE